MTPGNSGGRTPAFERAAATTRPQKATVTANPTIRTSLEVARTRASVLLTTTDTDPATQPGKSAHGVLAALLYAAALHDAGLNQAMAWAALGELDAPARILAEHRDRQDARAATAALVLTHHAEPAHYATVMGLVRTTLLKTMIEESR